MADQADTIEPTTMRPADPYVDRLVAELREHGLQVAARPPTLAVKNPAVAGTDPRGALISPGMTQEVLILDCGGHGLGWYWVWPGMRSNERGVPDPPPEIVFMCAAKEIEVAAGRIVKVVRLRDTESPRADDAPGSGG